MQEWLTTHYISFEEETLKTNLMNLVNSARWKYDIQCTTIKEIAKESGHTVLLSPPHFCELHSIELG
jgi:hypothetical protein